MARSEESRGLRDEANVGPDPRRARELRRMSDLGGWKVADGEPDIRHWPVYASTGREIGIVDDLLVDTEAGEVVMLDVDLKRNDRHTLAPLRAAWIDRGTKRVVLDAREVQRVEGEALGQALGTAETREPLPALPRHGTLSDDEMRRFNDDYVHAYGGRGAEHDREYRLRRGEEEIRFGLQPRADLPESGAPRRLLSQDERPHGDPLRAPAAPVTPAAATPASPDAAMTTGGGAYFDESRHINQTLGGMPMHRDAHDAGMNLGSPGRRDDDHARAESMRAGTDPATDPVTAFPDGADIEPRELDARVRIDEGATVDDRTPVGGVRYDTPNYPRHDYELSPEYDRSRVVSRHPADRVSADAADVAARLGDAERRAGEDRRVRYRTFPDDVGRPGEERR